MHKIKFEEIYSEYTNCSMEHIKSSRLNNGSYCLPSISRANVWYKIGMLAAKGLSTQDILKIIEEGLK